MTFRISMQEWFLGTVSGNRFASFKSVEYGERVSTMVDDGRTSSLSDLLREANDLKRPARSLRAIASLRERLDELAEFHVEHVVELGWSWGQVAAALGVSRQAAHKRYAGRLKRGFGSDRVTVTAAARRAVHRARAEAAAHGHRCVGPTHLLLSLLHPDAGAAADLLREAGASRDHLVRRLPPPSRRPPRGLPEVSADLRRLFERSLQEALDRGSDSLDAVHLLVALASSGSGAAARALADAGADRAAIVERLLSPERNVRTAA
jgi:hypothetical protein